MSFFIIIITPPDGDIITEFDIDPHTGSPLEEVHDNPLIVASHILLSLIGKTLMGEGGPMYVRAM